MKLRSPLFPILMLAMAAPYGANAATADSAEEESLIEGLPDPGRFIAEGFAGISVGNTRGIDNKFLDRDQHPVAMLLFGGFRMGMTMVEVLPENRYWSEYLGKVLAGGNAKGKFIQTADQANREIWERLSADRDYLLDRYETRIDLVPINYDTLVDAGTVDLVLMSRKMGKLAATNNLGRVAAAAFKSLKPGGRLLVEDFRAAPDQKTLASANGYINEDLSVAEIQKAGFKLLRKNDTLLANPKDTRAEALGHSDRFLLLFTK